MYQPISFNVIRQALDWHGWPIPALRQLSFRDLPELNAVCCEYQATWEEHQIPQRYFLPDGSGVSGVERFARDLSECFCSDVEVVNESWSEVTQSITCILYVRVDCAATLLTDWLAGCDASHQM